MQGFAPRDFAPAHPSLWAGCIGAWCPELGPTGTTVYDWSGFGRHGTINNATIGNVWVPSEGRYSFQGDGINDTLTMPLLAQPALTTNGTTVLAFSVSFWMRRTDSAPHFQWAQQDYSPQPFMLFRTTVSPSWYFNSGNQVDVQPTLNEWSHLAVTWSGTVWTCYLNGLVAGTYTGGVSNESNATALYFGNGYNFNSMSNFGDMRVYNRAMTANEIRTLSLRRGIAYEWRKAFRYRADDVAGTTPVSWWAWNLYGLNAGAA
jgi:hypothetical protein